MALKEQDTTQMQEHVNTLRDKFLKDIPPGYDSMTRREALMLAEGVIGIGGILTIYEELEDTIYTTVEAVVDGTKQQLSSPAGRRGPGHLHN